MHALYARKGIKRPSELPYRRARVRVGVRVRVRVRVAVPQSESTSSTKMMPG